MGQEWAASTPFLYFTDHDEDLGKIVTEGRRREFRHFLAFVDPEAREKIPDPQAVSTFEASRLDWSERDREPHASTLRLYRALLGLRRAEPALRANAAETHEAVALDDETLMLMREGPEGDRMLIVVRLRGEGAVDLSGHEEHGINDWVRWELVLTTEDAPFAPDPSPPGSTWTDPPPRSDSPGRRPSSSGGGRRTPHPKGGRRRPPPEGRIDSRVENKDRVAGAGHAVPCLSHPVLVPDLGPTLICPTTIPRRSRGFWPTVGTRLPGHGTLPVGFAPLLFATTSGKVGRRRTTWPSMAGKAEGISR